MNCEETRDKDTSRQGRKTLRGFMSFSDGSRNFDDKGG